MKLTDEQLMRYSRNIFLPEIDVSGQEKLLGAKVMVVGLGGLGSPVASYLAAAGIGELIISDFDVVEISNLQRQLIFSSKNIGEKKADAAKARILDINPDIEVHSISSSISEKNLRELINRADIVADCTDNLETRLAINDVCYQERKALVSAAAIKMEGQLMVIDPSNNINPCYRCLYDDGTDLGESCSESGVLGPLVGVLGSLQALEVIKILLNIGSSSAGKLITIDGRHLEWLKLNISKNPNCGTCKNSELN